MGLEFLKIPQKLFELNPESFQPSYYRYFCIFLAGLLLVLSGRTYEESALSLGIDIELMDRPVFAIRQPNLVDSDKTRLCFREKDVGDG